MLNVPRVRRGMSAALVSLALAATVLIPIGGVASAATATSACPTFEGPAECNLVITTPDTVLTFQTFTVQVAVTSGGEGNTVLPSSDLCAPVKVTLSVSLSEVSSATYTANAPGGIATFNISVSSDGLYDLQATAPSTATCSYNSGFGNVTAVFIPQTQPIAPCPDFVSCFQTFDFSGSAATLFADDGTFSGSFGSLTSGAGCTDGGPSDRGPLDPSGVLTFSYIPGTLDGPKTIVLALSASLVKKGIGQFQICWMSPNPFTQLGGTPAPLVGGSYTGYLPNCSKAVPAPCVLFRKSNQRNVAFFGIQAPPGDPGLYPR